jgi:uncharacterized coiled-coil protein SlyX
VGGRLLNWNFARHLISEPSVSKFQPQRNAKLASTSRRRAGKMFFMPDEMSRRMEKLESHVAHLEHQVEQLNDVVTAQDKLLERLKKEVQRQSSAMETIELERIKANNPKPPHH